MKRCGAGVVGFAFAILAGDLRAQFVDDSRNLIPFEQTDAWAMAYVTAATLMTGFGETPTLAPGALLLSAELGHIPRLGDAERRVGLGGIKQEDLNKSPVAGRGRVWVGLPYRFVAEFGYAPPIEIDGAKPRNLLSAAIARRWVDRDRWSLSSRVHGQIGSASGDITCSAEIAGNNDPAVNPFQCLEPSRDRIELNYYGAEFTTAFGLGTSDWRAHATLGAARFEPQVQIHADQRFVTNRSVLVASGTRPYLALGVGHRSTSRWHWSGEVLYVPLQVRRPGQALDTEAFWSLRLQLRHRLAQD